MHELLELADGRAARANPRAVPLRWGLARGVRNFGKSLIPLDSR